MKKFIAALTALVMLTALIPVTSLADTSGTFSATLIGFGDSGTAAAGTYAGNVMIACTGGESGSTTRAPYVSGTTASSSSTFGSTRVGVIGFTVDATHTANEIDSATIAVTVYHAECNGGSNWARLAFYETANPTLTYALGGMDESTFRAVNEDYSQGAAYWSSQYSQGGAGTEVTVDVTNALKNALSANEALASPASSVTFVMRIQVPTRGVYLYPASNATYMPTMEIEWSEKVTDGGKLTPLADSYVVANDATTNYGTDTQILITSTAGSGSAATNRYGYLKFDLSSITDITYIDSLSLYLYCYAATNSGTRSATAYGVSDNSWTESGITYNNAPSASSSALGSVDIAEGGTGWYEIELDPSYFNSLGSFGTVSIRLEASSAVTRFYSKNYSNSTYYPYLDVNYRTEAVSTSSVTVETVDENSNALAASQTVSNVLVGSTYTYTGSIESVLLVDGTYYSYDSSLSTTSITVSSTAASNVISLVYTALDDDDFFSGNYIGDGATCWFADPRALHYENASLGIDRTYIGYIDLHGYIKAVQYDHNTGEFEEILIRSNFQPDDHDNPTFLAIPDGRIMTFYSRHTDEACFYYRVSREVGDITTFGPEKIIKTANNTTYPSPFILSEAEGFFLCWRGINWHPTIAQFTFPDENGDLEYITAAKQIVQSTGARPYAKYESNGVDRICLTYTTGHPDNEYPNWVYYNELDVTNWNLYDVSGALLGNVSSSAYNVNKTSTSGVQVVDATATSRDWVWDVALDNGKPVIAMVDISNDKQTHNYYYVKWNGSSWTKTHLTYAGKYFHQSSNTENCYSGGMTIDHDDPKHIYASVPVEGFYGNVHEIIEYVMNDSGTAIVSTNQITKNSQYNNARPYLVRNSHASEMRLIWMNGLYYYWIVNSTYPNAYPTTMRTNFDFTRASTNLSSALTAHYEFATDQETAAVNSVNSNTTAINGTAGAAGGVMGLSDSGAMELDSFGNGSFTISAMVYFNGSSGYGGTVYDLGGGALKYTVSDEIPFPTLNSVALPMPHITVNGAVNTGSSPISNSDWHQTQSSTTDGNTNITNPGWSNIAIVYDASELTVKSYVDGLLDQTVFLEDTLSLSGESYLGGFDGYTANVYEYSRALNQEEIKALIDTFDESAIDYTRVDLIMALAGLDIVAADLVLPTQTKGGTAINWTSSNTSVITNGGVVIRPNVDTTLTLTATAGSESKTYTVTVPDRTQLDYNLMLYYPFNTPDAYTTGGVTYVRDRSGNGNDGILQGSLGAINGKLDLTNNSTSSATDNGYVIAPAGLLSKLRSYTFFMKVNMANTSSQYRAYDFGSGSGNSVFLRTNAFSAGLKYNGGTTQLVNSSTALTPGTEQYVAVTYSALDHTTKVYLDGVLVATGTNITTEGYQLYNIGADTRNYIGRTQWWNGTWNDNKDLVGTIDDFRMYDLALTQDEIAALMGTESFEVLDARADSAENTVSFYVTNTTDSPVSYDAYTAVFDDGGALIELAINSQTLSSGDAAEFSDTLVTDIDGKAVSIFIWNQDSQRPILDKITVQD